jgi:hypothetical protein
MEGKDSAQRIPLRRLCKRKGLGLSRPQTVGQNGTPRQNQYDLPQYDLRLTADFSWELSSHFAPLEPPLRQNRAWTRRDSNPHPLPSRGAVFAFHHGLNQNLLPCQCAVRYWDHGLSTSSPKTGARIDSTLNLLLSVFFFQSTPVSQHKLHSEHKPFRPLVILWMRRPALRLHPIPPPTPVRIRD